MDITKLNIKGDTDIKNNPLPYNVLVLDYKAIEELLAEYFNVPRDKVSMAVHTFLNEEGNLEYEPYVDIVTKNDGTYRDMRGYPQNGRVYGN